MTKFKLILVILYLIIPSLLFSQRLIENDVFVKTLEKKTKEFSNEYNFNKAQSFFIKKNWDSTLVSSMKQLHSSNNKELTDYCHYFRGSSYREKKLFKEAITELNLVSKNFEFYPLINKDLGENYLELKQYKKAIYYFKEVEKLPTTT
ncbi:MAG: histidine kinase, partial [Flavobacterium sp.]